MDRSVCPDMQHLARLSGVQYLSDVEDFTFDVELLSITGEQLGSLGCDGCYSRDGGKQHVCNEQHLDECSHFGVFVCQSKPVCLLTKRVVGIFCTARIEDSNNC
jgi:hypothetical protein